MLHGWTPHIVNYVGLLRDLLPDGTPMKRWAVMRGIIAELEVDVN